MRRRCSQALSSAANNANVAPAVWCLPRAAHAQQDVRQQRQHLGREPAIHILPDGARPATAQQLARGVDHMWRHLEQSPLPPTTRQQLQRATQSKQADTSDVANIFHQSGPCQFQPLRRALRLSRVLISQGCKSRGKSKSRTSTTWRWPAAAPPGSAVGSDCHRNAVECRLFDIPLDLYPLADEYPARRQ